MDSVLKFLGKIPGAIMVIPLILGAIFNTFFPGILGMGSFTTALFRDGAAVLVGMFLFCIGSQINVKTALPAVEKGIVMLLLKFGTAVGIGLGVAFFMPNGTLFGLLPLAIIAGMSNSNSTLYVALSAQFGSKTDKGAVSILSINDGPFLTMLALGAAGLANFPIMALISAIFPMILGFVIGNLSPIARNFLRPGELFIIPFVAFQLGVSVDLSVLLGNGAIGILLGVLTVFVSGPIIMGGLYLWHVLRRHPYPTRTITAGTMESAVAGNAIATPAAVVLVDPSLAGIQGQATAQIAAACITTALIVPFLVGYMAKRMRNAGISPEAEDAYHSRDRSKIFVWPPSEGVNKTEHDGKDNEAQDKDNNQLSAESKVMATHSSRVGVSVTTSGD